MQTYSWNPETRIPFPDFEVSNVCVNWEFYDGWMKEHAVDGYATGVLVHPTLGPSFPNGKEPHQHAGHT